MLDKCANDPITLGLPKFGSEKTLPRWGLRPHNILAKQYPNPIKFLFIDLD